MRLSIPLCGFRGGMAVAAHKAAIRKVFLLERFQISLPRNRNAIMLPANSRLPGGR
jgi:hypothetical protein